MEQFLVCSPDCRYKMYEYLVKDCGINKFYSDPYGSEVIRVKNCINNDLENSYRWLIFQLFSLHFYRQFKILSVSPLSSCAHHLARDRVFQRSEELLTTFSIVNVTKSDVHHLFRIILSKKFRKRLLESLCAAITACSCAKNIYSCSLCDGANKLNSNGVNAAEMANIQMRYTISQKIAFPTFARLFKLVYWLSNLLTNFHLHLSLMHGCTFPSCQNLGQNFS